jgi:cytoskeletal protein CcmA (bactofilin family)
MKQQPEADAPATNEMSLLGPDSAFSGTVRFAGTLRVDGRIQGDIVSPAGSGSILIVNAAAVVHGNIVSDSVLISGEVRGDIQARDRVEIFRSGSLVGDIHTSDIMIEGGASFQGQCHMQREHQSAAAPAREADVQTAAPDLTDAPLPNRQLG